MTINREGAQSKSQAASADLQKNATIDACITRNSIIPSPVGEGWNEGNHL